LRIEGLSPHYQLILTRPHRLDELTVRVECRPGYDAAERRSQGEKLRALVKENIGVTIGCDVVEPMTLERSQGKAQRLLDLRTP